MHRNQDNAFVATRFQRNIISIRMHGGMPPALRVVRARIAEMASFLRSGSRRISSECAALMSALEKIATKARGFIEAETVVDPRRNSKGGK